MTPDLTQSFTRAMRRPDAALLEIDRLECEESLVTFLERGWRYIAPKQFTPGWHLDAISEHLEAVTAGEIRRLVINIPPRMTKSSLVSVAWPVWCWAQREFSSPLSGPRTQFLSTSYAQSLSTRDSVKSRRLIQSPWYQERWGNRYSLTGDQNAKQRYDNNLGGYRLATSVGGALTGEGGDIILIDDPHNTIEIESEAIRLATIMWWDEALSTRLNDIENGAYVLVMQRLYDNDLTGHVLAEEEENWVHLMLPMEMDMSRRDFNSFGFIDPRTEEGELLCPERVPASRLPALKRRLGPFGVAGQLQQSPTARGGGIIKENYWQAWPPSVESIADMVDYRGRPLKSIMYPEMDYILASVDTAMTEKEENDPSAMGVWGVWRDKHDIPQIMMMDAWEAWLPQDELVDKIMTTCTKRKVDRLIIEGKNNGIAAVQTISRLVRGDWATQASPVQGDKVARALATVPTFAAGQVWAPARNIDGTIRFLSWAQKVIDQCAVFPKGEHDDMVDQTTQAINHLRRGGMLQTRAERREELAHRLAPPGKKEPLYGIM